MNGERQTCNPIFHIISHTRMAAMAIAIAAVLTGPMQGQTFNVIYNFAAGPDGAYPVSGLTIDAAGNIYGTTAAGGTGQCAYEWVTGCGTVFKLSQSNGAWQLTSLYSFAGGADGSCPQARVVIGPDGSLYGTTSQGGGTYYCEAIKDGFGTVFNLRMTSTTSTTPSSSWSETVLHRFGGRSSDGKWPTWSDLIFGQDGELYGTTVYGGTRQGGTLFVLGRTNRNWKEGVPYSFIGGGVYSGVISDRLGNLYGTYYNSEYGVVYELMPSTSGWVEQTLYTFQGGTNGYDPMGGLVFDQSGNLFGTTAFGGTGGAGTVYELSPSSGGWVFTTLYNFPSGAFGPSASLTIDVSGSLYGTTASDGPSYAGSVFKLTCSGNGWTYTSLHDFIGSDGNSPMGTIALDSRGNVWGTASGGGTGLGCPASGCGVVWEITP